jgi:hypothetical protein
MQPPPVAAHEVFGLIKPAVDAHTLGLNAVADLLRDCGYRVVLGDAAVGHALAALDDPAQRAALQAWLRAHGITRLGCSYRLDPGDAKAFMLRLHACLVALHAFAEDGGSLRAVYFAGLPAACTLVAQTFHGAVSTFAGDETPVETLHKLGVPDARIPRTTHEQAAYDDLRLAVGRQVLSSAAHTAIKPVDRSGYAEYGMRQDALLRRLAHGRAHGLPPLMRAHVGPYRPDRAEALREFNAWLHSLAHAGHLDVVSIGTSQLTQSQFGDDWGAQPNGGGVPVNAPDEYRRMWEAARPMLVRTYAGTRNIPALARMHEETLHIAWHALSFWWFCRIDGRGPYDVYTNLCQHCDTLRFIAARGTPFEPNVPHHFAFRGADDVTYVVAAVIAARTAKCHGIQHLVLQLMLNTPKSTWGVQDLAKARATLQLVRELEDARFHVMVQPRAGLDYFSPDTDKAKVQLAAVTALMDDIEPDNHASPDIIHVVSYSEATRLADPPVIDESICITRAARAHYRAMRARGAVPHMGRDAAVHARTEHLCAEARMLLDAIEQHIPEPYTPRGLYHLFAAGFLPVPYLWECRDEFAHACAWRTRLHNGGVALVDATGAPINAAARAQHCIAVAAGFTPPAAERAHA